MLDRLDEPGSEHHLMVHAVHGQPMFHDGVDRGTYAGRVREVVQRAGALLTSFDFTMTTHSHMKVIVGNVGLEDIMRDVNSWYARWFNWRHHRRGHLMMDDFKSKLVGEEPYSRRLTRYIIRNPLAAGIYRQLDDLLENPYSCWAELIGYREPELLDRIPALRPFGASIEEAVTVLQSFMIDPHCEEERLLFEGFSPLQLDGRIVVTPLGSDEFFARAFGEAARRRIERERLLSRGWTVQRLLEVAALSSNTSTDAVLHGRARSESNLRSAVTWIAARKLGMKQVEIARVLNLSEGAVSLAVKRATELPVLQDVLRALEAEC